MAEISVTLERGENILEVVLPNGPQILAAVENASPVISAELIGTGPAGPAGPRGPAGAGVPEGGAAGQMLVKNSGADRDAGWSSDAYRAVSIPAGRLDSSSTATVMTAAVDGVTELRDGVCMWLTNAVVTSAAGFTLNVNGLGAKPVYSSQAAATAATTQFNKAYTALLIFNASRVEGGCWDYVYGYDSNTTYTPPKLGFGYATCSTAEATAAKTVSISNYALTAGGAVSVKFTNAVPANATLNVSSKGAKAIYYRGAAITAGIIKAGDTATFVYSTYYHLISVDRQPTAAEVGAIPAPASPGAGQFLQWDGSAWAAASLPVYDGGVS